MAAWTIWTTVGTALWLVIAGLLLRTVSMLHLTDPSFGHQVRPSESEASAVPSDRGARPPELPAETDEGPAPRDVSAPPHEESVDSESFDGESLFSRPLHILVVDDDPNLRALLRTSFGVADIEVEEADGALAAATKIDSRHPDVIVLDVAMPQVSGITFCKGLKADPFTRDIPIILLTGDPAAEGAARACGADAFLRKPFSPLELLTLAERLSAQSSPAGLSKGESPSSHQLLLYAQDFRRLLDLERGQRQLLQNAYRETVVALARALESKHSATGAHSERVRLYAAELTDAIDASLLDQPGLEYGFILHDVGKIGIPDEVLKKPGPLTDSERRLIETHTVLGEQMVGEAALLRGQGAQVVRSHHERWDGAGYPDRVAGGEIPLGARIFSVADALDAMTSDRPYRPAGPWDDAVAEIVGRAGSQFDPEVVDVFRDREEALRHIYGEFNTN
jgi:response regulator RpfG family c-di-GMP phosphodiesterase